MQKDVIEQRNQEIAELLHRTRNGKNVPATKCAQMLGTSRRRYNAIERGETPISVGELEVLMRFLDIPVDRLWPVQAQPAQSDQKPVVVHVPQGQEVHLVITSESAGT